MSLLLQGSDTHFGTERPEVVVALARSRRPDVLVLSGNHDRRQHHPRMALGRCGCGREQPRWEGDARYSSAARNHLEVAKEAGSVRDPDGVAQLRVVAHATVSGAQGVVIVRERDDQVSSAREDRRPFLHRLRGVGNDVRPAVGHEHRRRLRRRVLHGRGTRGRLGRKGVESYWVRVVTSRASTRRASSKSITQ